jgi:hypothetical protein
MNFLQGEELNYFLTRFLETVTYCVQDERKNIRTLEPGSIKHEKATQELGHFHNLVPAYNADEEKAEDERKGMMKIYKQSKISRRLRGK